MKNATHIELSNGNLAIISAEDIDLVSRFSWYPHCGYARGFVDGKPAYMHRLILQARPGTICDHINGDRMDNRRENLRLVDRYSNARNRSTGTGHIGVSQAGQRYSARIERCGEVYCLGHYESEILAAYAVDVARSIHDGELMRPNVPGFTPPVDVARTIAARVRAVLRGPKYQPNKKRGPTAKEIEAMRNSPLSDRYWANRTGLRLKDIKALRS